MLKHLDLPVVPVAVLMVIAGKYLHEEGHKFITPALLQGAIVDTPEVGYRISFTACGDALEMLYAGGFLTYGDHEEVFNGVVYKEYVLVRVN